MLYSRELSRMFSLLNQHGIHLITCEEISWNVVLDSNTWGAL